MIQSNEHAVLSASTGRLGEIFLFTFIIAFSCLTVIAVAIAAPFVLAASAIAGLFAKQDAPRGWRPSGA